jgi:type VI secretion system secreted protein VgrG
MGIDTSVSIRVVFEDGLELTNGGTTSKGQNTKQFNSLTLWQSVAEHHTFEIHCYHGVLEDPKAEMINKSQNLVGKELSIIMKQEGGDIENKFKGVITEVGMVQGDGMFHDIIIKGYGKTIKIENGPRLKSFLEKTLTDIVSEVYNKNNMKRVGNIAFSEKFKYCAQFNESDFCFLRRLAAIHGEWFYYNGEDLVFGEPSSLSTIQLQHGKNLTSLSLGMSAAAMQFEAFGFNSGRDGVAPGIMKSPSPGSITGSDAFGSKMFSASKNIYASKYNFMPRQVINSQGGLDNFAKGYLGNIASDLVEVNATGDYPLVGVGIIAEIQTYSGSTYGKYLITDVTHHADGMGGYTNSFTGIPSTLKVLPNPHFHKPSADSEMAIVVDNKDPDQMGRVRVKFPWMSGEQTWWIHTTQPYGGGKDGSSFNRGFVFIPEIDDEVLIAFEHGDCDKPFVLCSLMNSKALVVKNSDNDGNLFKAINTRDNSIAMRDKSSGDAPIGVAVRTYAGSSTYQAQLLLVNKGNKTNAVLETVDEITIQTLKGEVKIVMNKDGKILIKGDNITVDASDTIHMKAKNIKMEAQENITTKSTQNTTIEATQNVEIKSTQNTKISALKLTEEATTDVEIKGLNVKIGANIAAEVKGNATAELSASGMTTVKGALVMIN